MIIARRWVDDSGAARVELATWVRAEPSDPRGQMLVPPADAEVREGSPADLAAPVILVALTDSPVAVDALGSDLSGLYDAPMTAGAKVVSVTKHAAAARKERAVAEATALAIDDELFQLAEERAAPRRAMLKKLADSAGLDADELALLIGED